MNSIQSFNLDNFQKIFDYENRKGNNIEEIYSNYFSESLALLPNIKDITKKIRECSDENERVILLQERNNLRNKRIETISNVIQKVVDNISLERYKIQIFKGRVYGKQTFHLENSLENFFISKKIQYNISRLYSVKPAHRDTIIKDIINNLENKIPKWIIRTDIKSFFESIPQNKLIQKINDDYLLSIQSKRIINETIKSYNKLTSQENHEKALGIPRGIGFSSYLAELYMRDIDNAIKKINDVVYYARYVDDIIVIFSPKSRLADRLFTEEYKNAIQDIILNAGLEINFSKTRTYNLLKGVEEIEIDTHYKDNTSRKVDYQKAIEFLGYNIGSRNLYKSSSNKQLINTKIIVDMVLDKKERYKDKIFKSFQTFEQKQLHNNKKAYKLLKARVQYLTTNTQLINNKENVFVGIYFSNKYINTMYTLNLLQKYLMTCIDNSNLTGIQKKQLNKYSFIGGFVTKEYHKYTIKNKRHKINKGIINFGFVEINSIWK